MQIRPDQVGKLEDQQCLILNEGTLGKLHSVQIKNTVPGRCLSEGVCLSTFTGDQNPHPMMIKSKDLCCKECPNRNLKSLGMATSITF